MKKVSSDKKTFWVKHPATIYPGPRNVPDPLDPDSQHWQKFILATVFSQTLYIELKVRPTLKKTLARNVNQNDEWFSIPERVRGSVALREQAERFGRNVDT